MKHALPPMRLLAAFAAVARTGSVQSAAAFLNVTQPAVSQAVKQLEAYCGARLLDRERRPARLTEAGQALARAIDEGLGRIEASLDQIRQSELAQGHSVTVACSVGVATYWLMPRLAAFYEAFPMLTVNVLTTQSGAPDLAETVDTAIRYGHGRWADGAVAHLFDEEVEPVCSPGLLARHGGLLRIDTAALLHVRAPEPSWMTWRDYLEGNGMAVPTRPGQTFTNYVQATQAAVEGQGVMLGWLSITGGMVAAGRLVSAGLPKVRPVDAMFLVTRPKRRSQAAEAFSNWLRASAARAPRAMAAHAP